jgi:hypothetical protein
MRSGSPRRIGKQKGIAMSRRVLTHFAALAVGASLGTAGLAIAGTGGQPKARDDVARAQIAAVQKTLALLPDSLNQINATLNDKLYRLCRATASNPAYTGCG